MNPKKEVLWSLWVWLGAEIASGFGIDGCGSARTTYGDCKGQPMQQQCLLQ